MKEEKSKSSFCLRAISVVLLYFCNLVIQKPDRNETHTPVHGVEFVGVTIWFGLINILMSRIKVRDRHVSFLGRREHTKIVFFISFFPL